MTTKDDGGSTLHRRNIMTEDMRIMIAIILGEYPEDDERYQKAVIIARKYDIDIREMI